MYGMHKTTVYLTDQLHDALRFKARTENKSEALIIREAIETVTAPIPRPPEFHTFGGGPADLAENADKYLKGFGED